MRSVTFVILWSVGIAGCASRDNGGGPPLMLDSGVADGTVMMGDSATSPDTSLPVESPYVDPACTDGQYSEALPNASADISDLVAGYSPATVNSFFVSVLDRRYPIGAQLVSEGLQASWFAEQYGSDCVTWFLAGQTASAEQAFGRLGTVVHECGHVVDIAKSMSGAGDYYQITDTLSFQCTGGNSSQLGGQTVARSLINADSYSALRAPCGVQCGQPSPMGCDSYADCYLNGNPNDQQFDSGDQGFSVLFEEVVQYVNSIATGYAFLDQQNPQLRTSARDGMFTFLWYMQRYLKYTRENFPTAYAAIVNDSCWQDAILTVWGRAWLFLEATKDEQSLSIEGPALEALVLDETLLGEIERIRTASGCN